MSSPPQPQQLYTERVYIDPQRLLKLRSQRKAFKQVPSIFEPPPQIQQITNITENQHMSISAKNSYKVSTSSRMKQSFVHKDYKENGEGKLHEELIQRSVAANIDFVVSVLGKNIKQDMILWYEEGDCLNLQQEGRCIILEGQVKVTAVGNRSFTLKEGHILFLTHPTIAKVRQLLILRPTKLLKLSQSLFPSLRNYLFLKNSQKLKYLKYCPFFIWSQTLSQDLAACMTMRIYQKGQKIYERGQRGDQIFFVKEGVVLLERNQNVRNQVVREYEGHYQRSQVSQSQITLVVKKGMVFGVDGVLLKDIGTSSSSSQPVSRQYPQNPQLSTRNNPSSRIYSARPLGRTQVYVLPRSVLQGLFDLKDIISFTSISQKQAPPLQTLNKIAADYSNLVVRHRSLPKISQAVSNRVMNFEGSRLGQDEENEQKRMRVRERRRQEENVKKNTIANIMVDNSGRGGIGGISGIGDRRRDGSHGKLNNSIVLQQHFAYKLGLTQQLQQSGLAFPRLSSNLRKKRSPRKSMNPNGQSIQKFIIGWLKCQDPAKPQQQQRKITDKQKCNAGKGKSRQKLSLINVRSYRSIVPGLI